MLTHALLASVTGQVLMHILTSFIAGLHMYQAQFQHHILPNFQVPQRYNQQNQIVEMVLVPRI